MINNNSLSFPNTPFPPEMLQQPLHTWPWLRLTVSAWLRWEKTGMTKVWVELENKFLFGENCQVRMLSRSFNIINVPSLVCRSYLTLSTASNTLTVVYSQNYTVKQRSSSVQSSTFWKVVLVVASYLPPQVISAQCPRSYTVISWHLSETYIVYQMIWGAN